MSDQIDDLVRDCSISNVLAMEILQINTNIPYGHNQCYAEEHNLIILFIKTDQFIKGYLYLSVDNVYFFSWFLQKMGFTFTQFQHDVPF